MTFTLVPNKTLTVVTAANEVFTTQSDHVNWSKIMDALKLNDEALVVNLMNVKRAVTNFGSNLSYTGTIEVRGNEVFYRGEKLFGEDVNRMLAFMKEGIPADGLIQFLERKLGNPSSRSIASMYSFLDNKQMPIQPNGTFVGFKGVRSDYFSKNTGSEALIKGHRREDGAINNSVGQEIRMERRFVCDDFGNACGPGLHVGSLSYAKGWAGPDGKVVLVEVDPADVVTVPDAEIEKLRCCGYKVIGEYSGPLNDVFTSEFTPTEQTGDESDYCQDCGYNYEDCSCNACGECGYDLDDCVCSESDNAIYADSDVVDSEYTKGRTLGITHGKGHAKRLYHDEDESNTRRKNTDYIIGYNEGYRQGRSGC